MPRSILISLSLAAVLAALAGERATAQVAVPEASAPVSADELTAEQKERARTLIHHLESDDFDRREAALRELASLGRGVRPLIEAALPQAGLEARLRLETLLKSFPDETEAVAIELSPSRLSFEGEDVAVARVLEQLERQGGLDFRRPHGLDPRRTLDIRWSETPLLKALDLLSDDLDVRWTLNAGTGLIQFTPASGKPLRIYSGPFRFSLVSVMHSSRLVFGSEPRRDSHAQGYVDIEPGAPVVGVWMPPEPDRIEDEHGQDLTPTDKLMRHFTPTGLRRAFHFSMRFTAPGDASRRLAVFAGRFTVAVPSRYDVIRLDVPADGGRATASSASITAQIAEKSSTPEAVHVRVELEREALYADEHRRQQVTDEIFEFRTAEGELVVPERAPTRQVVGDKEVFRLQLAPGRALETLTIRSLAKFEPREIRFEFRDVPLP